MEYVALQPLAHNVPLIEIQPEAGGALDLYNRHRLAEVVLAQASLTFGFEEVDTGDRVRLEFGEVRNLLLTQPDDWDPREADQIDHLLVRPPGEWRHVEFNAGGRIYEFDAARLSLSRQSSDA